MLGNERDYTYSCAELRRAFRIGPARYQRVAKGCQVAAPHLHAAPAADKYGDNCEVYVKADCNSCKSEYANSIFIWKGAPPASSLQR